MIGQMPSTVTSGPTDPFPHPEACPTVTHCLAWGVEMWEAGPTGLPKLLLRSY